MIFKKIQSQLFTVVMVNLFVNSSLFAMGTEPVGYNSKKTTSEMSGKKYLGYNDKLYFVRSSNLVKINSNSRYRLVLSAQEAIQSEEFKQNNLAPMGSAVLTTSGQMSSGGITGIIHAATGDMAQNYPATLQSIRAAIRNSVIIANREGFNRVAIPMVGGGIFLNNLKDESNQPVTRKRLAYEIISSALSVKSKTEIVFLAYKDISKNIDESVDFKNSFEKFNSNTASKSFQINEDKFISFLNSILSYLGLEKNKQKQSNDSAIPAASVMVGSITNFKDHHADVIVNAANMEVEFGGGISGVIGRATGISQEINQDANVFLQDYYARSQDK